VPITLSSAATLTAAAVQTSAHTTGSVKATPVPAQFTGGAAAAGKGVVAGGVVGGVVLAVVGML
jgi:hypothetical protein